MRAGDREKIGPHGLEVTRLGLGGTTFGNMYSVLSEQEGLDVLDAAFAAGVRYFDTAPLYGYGLSETRLGPGLARYDRDEIVLSSKVGYTLVERKPGDDYVDLFIDAPEMTSYFDFSRDAVLRSIEGSLERLKMDRLDMVLIHDPDEGKSIEPDWTPGERGYFDQVMAETYPVLDELRQQKVIKALGLGMNQWQMLADFARAGDFDAFFIGWPLYAVGAGIAARVVAAVFGEGGSDRHWRGRTIRGFWLPERSKVRITTTRRQRKMCWRRCAALRRSALGTRCPCRPAALQFPFGHPAGGDRHPWSADGCGSCRQCGLPRACDSC